MLESTEYFSAVAVFERIEAAMFKSISSGKTKISVSGYSVVFVTPVLGRYDLSNDVNRALWQLKSVNISIDDVSDKDIAAYKNWFDPIYNERRIGRARILITDKFPCQFDRDELEMVNEVRLIDGWGQVLRRCVIKCVYGVPDTGKIWRAIEMVRLEQPEYSNAPVQDNSKTNFSPRSGASVWKLVTPRS